LGISGGSDTITTEILFDEVTIATTSTNVSIQDNTNPNIEVDLPTSLSKTERLTIVANVTDHSQISSVKLFYSLDNGASFTEKTMVETESGLYGTIAGPFDVPKVIIYLKATDEFSNEGQTNQFTILIQEYQISTTTTTETTTTETERGTDFNLIAILPFFLLFIAWRRKRKI
jgi:hypothetical protein